MHSPKRKNQRLYLTLALIGLLILFSWSKLAEARPPTAKQHLEQAWRIAADAGRFEYQTNVEQITRPTARLENAGRSSTSQQLRAEGWVNRADNAMQLRLWSSQAGQRGIELKVEGERAYGRTSANDVWAEIPNPTNIFAPGGDPLGFLVAAENVRAGDGGQGLERQELTLDDVLGNPQLANPNSQLPGSTSYTFDLSGPRYADYVHDQLETAMRERGDLPPGVNLGLVRQFAGMTGHGEIWLDAEGLPIQQVIHLEFPAARGALDRMDADITTTFRGWESAGRGVGTGALVRQTWQDPQFLVQQFLSSKSLKEISMALGASLLMAALALMAFTYRRSLKFYRAVILALIAVMVVTPLLQSHHVHAFNSGQQQRQVDFEQRQQAAQQNADAQAGLDSDFDPTLNPLEARNQEVVVEGAVSQVPNSYSLRADLEPAAAAAAATAQTSLSGCDYDTDSDGDTLTDYTECYKLDTFTDTVDSDIDGISDITEVQGFTLNGQQWYLNPLDTDSNGDGFADAVECPALADVDEMGNLTNPFGSTCVDTDGDNTPDVFDFDNDGDGVPDRIDASPNYVGNLSTNAANDFSLALDGHDAAGRMLVVDFQLRPTNIDHLFQTNNVFDWPENDTQGQITRINDNTLADLGYNGPRTNRGDIILSPMLEIKIPDPTNNSNNPSGGLPVRSDFNGDYAASPLTDWLDTDTLDHFNITVNHDETDDTLTAYMPLTLVEDTLGDTPVAWGTQMVYQPEGSLWGDDHKVRLVWLVQALLDSCDISGIGENDTYDEWCATNSGNWVTSMAVIQTYYEDFTLTGLSVREDYGMDMAVIAQTDALTVDYENYLWHLSNNLLATFGEGRLIDDDNDDIGDRRFDFDEIITRFGGTSGTMWDIPVNLIAVDSVTYTNQITGLAGMFNTQIPNVLSTHYSGAATDDDVTLLFAREESYKTTSLGSASVDDAVFGKLTLSLGGLTQQTYSTLNWSPYQYDASGEWLSKDLYDYYDILETKLTSAISNGEIDSMLGWFGESGQEFSTLTKGAIGLARNYYTTMYMGSSNPVFDSDYGNISDAVVVDNVLDMDFDDDGSPDEAALLIVGTSLGLMQLFFQREGDLILDQVYEILWTIGEIEKDIDDDDDDSLAQTLAIAGIQLSKSLIKKLVSELEGKVRGTVKYYKYSSRTSQATTSISMLSGAIAAANFLYFDSENQYLTFASNTLDLAEVAIDTADTAYTYYRMTQGFGVTDIMLVETTTSKLESSTKTSAIIGLVIDIAVASTIFAFSVKNAPPGSMAFNAALAQFIADIITAIIIAIIAATLIGSLVLAVIGLIDAVIAAVCRWNGQDEPKAVEVWVCGGIESAFTTALRYAIYDQYVLVDMDKTNRLSIGMHDPVLQQIGDTSGYVVGNELQVGATVTTSLSLNDPTGIVRTTYVKNGKLDRDTLGRLMRKSTFAYKLQHGEYDIHSNLDKGDVDWGSDNTGIFAATTAVPLDTPGINYSLPLYLTEGFHVNVIECWGFVGAVEEISCKQRSLKGSSHIYLGDDFTMDILPATLDEFISVTPLGNQSYRLSWDTRFSTLIDGDGDGLRSKATGGPDPDDNTWDADSDGLSDFWELDNGFDPLQADGDNDNLFDYWEAFYNTNPRLADTDSDGLLDGEEFYHSQSRHPFVDESQPWSGGCDIIYPTLGGQTDTAWVSADPLAYDGDNDSISDKREQVYGYNPNLASVLNILTLNSEVSSPAVQPGGTLAYTATIKNELDGRTLNGLLQAELPVDVVRNTEVMAQLTPLQTITMSGQLTVPVVAQSTPTSLTLRAGVAVSSSIVEANPPGPVFYLDEFNFNPTSGYNQFDDSGYNHTVTCNASSTSISCPADGIAVVNDGFSFNLDDNRMDVNGRNSLKLGSNGNTFSMMMWINPRQGYSPDNDYYNEFGVNVLGQNFYASPKNDFPSLTLKGRKVQIHFGHQDGLGYCLATSSSILTYNEWQHLAVIFDGGQFQFYLDGVLAETETGDNCAGQDLYPAKDFTIGQTDGAAAYFHRLEPRKASLDEGYIWSNDNIFYNNGATYRESECCYSTSDNPKLIWYSKEFHIHIQPNGDKYISYPDAWAVSGKSDLTFWVCNLDEEDVVGAPNGCLSSDNNSDEPMYYKKNGSKEYERIYSSTYSPAQYVLEYDKGYKNNKWGAYIDFDLYNNAFLGDLDEIALYNTNLSQESVEDIYIASLRTAYLTFDEPPGQDSFEDATAYATVATCSGANCPDSGIPGRDNQALRFDGIDDYVQFPQPLDSAAQLFTAAAWFKIDNLDTNQAILQQQDGSSTGRTWLWVLSNGQIRTFLGGSNLDSGAGNVVTPGSWHHAAVAANSGTVKLYLDGQLVNQASQSVQASDGGLLIGAHKSLSSGFFDGLIDEVVIQRGALNVSQTVQLMLEAPVLNLHLDENLNVTNFSDDTPYANDATCSANTCPGTGTKGQIREAIVLERNDVITTSIANVNIDKSNFSVAMWVRPD
ncbi:MAG: LamG domain-containing protein, partial [Chloroflexi bacterium]|nr:LamG domain-containing protein [Chloroflexota bacterium]